MLRRLALPLLLLVACVARLEPERPASEREDDADAAVPQRPEIVVTDEEATPAAAEPGELELPPPPDSVMSALYAKQLDFRAGEPMLPIRLMEQQQEVTFEALGRVRLSVAGTVAKRVEAPAGTRFRVRVLEGRPAEVRVRVVLAELPGRDREGLDAARALWTERGLEVSVVTLGGAFGIAGKVIDNRRRLLVTPAMRAPEEAAAEQTRLLQTFNARTHLHEELVAPPTGVLELLDAAGASVALGEGRILAETPGGEGFRVHQVEYGVGYDFHGFEDRTFRGSLQLSVDRFGGLAVVNIVPLEVLLYGLVPAEIFARSHAEALKAQAVTARGEVLAKIGTKHLADPYLLCSEQHCAVYKGRSAEFPTTTAAVDATRGQGLFDARGTLVDSVYSAVCGGHTENNEHVWGGPPNPSLRGRPDVPEPPEPGIDEGALPAFLEGGQTAYCQTASFAQPRRFRWSRRFTAPQVNALTAQLGVGPVHALTVVERGVSGRARLLTISGEHKAVQIRGELNIRRLFGMLNSSMFTLHPEVEEDGTPLAWTFRGGGWGHGVGMCQTGAIGRAEAGQDYRQILGHYYNGAEVAPIY